MASDVTHLYAWLMHDQEGHERVPAIADDLGVWRPLMGPDLSVMEGLQAMAMQTARIAGQPIRLVAFTRRELLQELTP